MGIPILTSAGFVGQRWIIDDYFQAGETIYSGEVVKMLADADSEPKLFKVDGGHQRDKVIGVVHTPPGEVVGGVTYEVNDFVPVVVQGIAKAVSYEAIEVGDPVVPSGYRVTGPAPHRKLMATVEPASKHDHSPEEDAKTGAGEQHAHTSPSGEAGGGHDHSGGTTSGSAGGHSHSTISDMSESGVHKHEPGTAGESDGLHKHNVENTSYESAHKHDDAGDHEHEIATLGNSFAWQDPTYQRLLTFRDTDGGYQYTRIPANVPSNDSDDIRTKGQVSDHDHGTGSQHRHSSFDTQDAGAHSHAGAGDTEDAAGHKHTAGDISTVAGHTHDIGDLGAVADHTHGEGGDTGGESAHKHGLTAIDRAAVVGKCLTAASGGRQEIEILVDIAG